MCIPIVKDMMFLGSFWLTSLKKPELLLGHSVNGPHSVTWKADVTGCFAIILQVLTGCSTLFCL